MTAGSLAHPQVSLEDRSTTRKIPKHRHPRWKEIIYLPACYLSMDGMRRYRGRIISRGRSLFIHKLETALVRALRRNIEEKSRERRDERSFRVYKSSTVSVGSRQWNNNIDRVCESLVRLACARARISVAMHELRQISAAPITLYPITVPYLYHQLGINKIVDANLKLLYQFERVSNWQDFARKSSCVRSSLKLIQQFMRTPNITRNYIF